MTEKEFKSITGLCNYAGFKFLLENGLATNRYTNTDDTIVFNSLRTHSSSTAGSDTLNTNQVAVILNSSNNFSPIIIGPSAMASANWWRTKDVDGNDINIQNVSYPNLLVCREFIANAGPNFPGNDTITYAVFDLY